MSQYIQIISKLKQKNNQTYKLMDLTDIDVNFSTDDYNVFCSNGNTDYLIASVGARTARTSVPQVIVQGDNEAYLVFSNTFLNESTTDTIDVNQVGLYIGANSINYVIMPFRYVFPQQ